MANNDVPFEENLVDTKAKNKEDTNNDNNVSFNILRNCDMF